MTMTADRVDTTEDGSRPRRDRGTKRRGSFHSDRQVAFAVRDGKAVTAIIATGEQITGWVFGADDYHWSIVTADGGIVLVHKSSPALKIHRTPSLSTAPASIQSLVSRFRDALLRDHFHQSPDKQ